MFLSPTAVPTYLSMATRTVHAHRFTLPLLVQGLHKYYEIHLFVFDSS